MRQRGRHIAGIEVVEGTARWSQVDDLEAAGPEDRCYAVVEDDDGYTVRFRDGVHGQRPPPGMAIRAALEGGDRITVVLGSGSDPTADPDRSGGAGEGMLPVTLERSSSVPTEDQLLWAVIRQSTQALTFTTYRQFGDGGPEGQAVPHGEAGFCEHHESPPQS
jgi:hypothetical protein